MIHLTRAFTVMPRSSWIPDWSSQPHSDRSTDTATSRHEQGPDQTDHQASDPRGGPGENAVAGHCAFSGGRGRVLRSDRPRAAE